MKKQFSWHTLPLVLWRKGVNFFHVVRQAAGEFHSDNALKLSASLSYYTLFSLAPMLIIAIAISSIYFGKEAAEGYVYKQFEGLMGPLGAMQLQEMIRNVHISGDTPWVTAISIITLLFGATGVFVEIQDSINTIWSLKVKPKRSWVKFLEDRLLSFSLIVGVGFLLLVSLITSAMLNMIYDYLAPILGQYVLLTIAITQVIDIGTVILIFSVIFKVLPDAKLKWRDVLTGASFTAVLFLGGKWVVNYYLGKSATVSIYGAAGAVVLIILWIYYSSAILFFGAEFTKVYANKHGGKIRPNAFAVFIEKKEVVVDHVVLHTEEPK